MLRNLTPHALNIYTRDSGYWAEGLTLPPSGEVARVTTTSEEVGMIDGGANVFGLPIFETRLGEVEGLPDPQEGVWYVVSAMVRAASSDREDLLSPGKLVRDAEGRPIGCEGLTR